MPSSSDRAGSRDVAISRPDKELWPGVTKRAYADYLHAVAGDMLPWLHDRPLTMVRAPDGVGAHRYFQKAAPTYAPDWIATTRIPAPSAGRDVDYVVCQDLPTLLWLGNQAVLEHHVAPVRRDRLDRPDLLVVDLDPPDDAFAMAVEAALLVLEVLDDLGLPSGVKTTGGKGLHVVVPIERRLDQAALRDAVTTLTGIVVERRPDLVTDAFRKAKRGGRVMLDPSRNGLGATIVAPYSPRAREGAPVSFPVVPEELSRISPGELTVGTVPGLLDRPGPKRWRALAEERGRLPRRLRDRS
ncbi:MAG TPA: non-homologous end-joining DNA ligase [Actinomycetota bacterium]|nr:non-homologous end-joining DNA ligase [Actinomycetota bacterium]